MFDNRIFNVNGRGDELLLKALELAFALEGEKTTCKGFINHPEKGLILCWWTVADNS